MTKPTEMITIRPQISTIYSKISMIKNEICSTEKSAMSWGRDSWSVCSKWFYHFEYHGSRTHPNTSIHLKIQCFVYSMLNCVPAHHCCDHLPDSLHQSAIFLWSHISLRHHQQHSCHSPHGFYFTCHSGKTLEICVCESPRGHLVPAAMPWVTSQHSHLFSVLMFDIKLLT